MLKVEIGGLVWSAPVCLKLSEIDPKQDDLHVAVSLSISLELLVL